MTHSLKLEKILLVILATILCLLGLFFVFESSALESFKRDGTPFYLVKNQALGFLLGLGALIGASFIPIKTYLKFPYFFYCLALVLLGLCFFDGFGTVLQGNIDVNGARRWLYIFGISVQVAEIVKFCLVIFFAYLLTKVNDYQIFLAYLAPPVALMLLQKDLGSLLVILAISFGLFFLSGASNKIIIKIGLFGLVAVLLMIVLSPYRRERFLTWINPSQNVQGEGYHLNQLLIAIGRGGLTGKGIGQSRQKFAYVPEVSSDSIFSIVAEEIGFIGVSFILLIYMFFLYLIWRIIQLAPLELPTKMVGYGIFILFVSQIFINLGAISGLTPLTGITLPFFSAGSSSLIISLFLVGVILSLANCQPTFKIRKKRYV